MYLLYVFYGSLDTENVNPFLTVFLIALHTSLHSNNVFFYSLYDGANNKEMVKKQFQQTLDQVIERLTRLVRR